MALEVERRGRQGRAAAETETGAPTFGAAEAQAAEPEAPAAEEPARPSPEERSPGVFYRQEAPPESFWEYLDDRTKLAIGYDLTFDDNVLRQDNNKQEDLVSVLESQLFYLETTGSLVYGVTYEVNAYRHHRLSANKLDHDLSAFLDIEPAAPYKLGFSYGLDVFNRLVVTTDKTEIFSRNSDFQRQVKHEGTVDASYDLTDRDTLDAELTYLNLDEQAQPDAARDRREFSIEPSFRHELRPGLTFSAGYLFERKRFPGDEDRSSKEHSGVLGLEYQFAQDADLNLELEFGKIQFKGQEDKEILNFNADLVYPVNLNPRWTVELGYDDEQDTSEAVSGTTVRTRTSSLSTTYELTPRVELTGKAQYVKTRAGSTTGSTTFGRKYDLSLKIAWLARENFTVSLTGEYGRNKSSDITERRILLEMGFEL